MQQQRAFTLLEVLIALGLGAMVMVAVQSLAVHTFRVHETIRSSARDSAIARLPDVVLQQDLANLPLGATIELQDGVLRFDTLASLHDDRAAARVPVHVSYSAEGRAGKFALVRSERALQAEEETATEVILLETSQPVEISVQHRTHWLDALREPLAVQDIGAVRIRLAGEQSQPTAILIPVHPPAWRHHHAK